MFHSSGESHTRSDRFGFPGGSFGRDDGLGGRGGMGLPADSGVPARAGEDGPKNIKSDYYYRRIIIIINATAKIIIMVQSRFLLTSFIC